MNTKWSMFSMPAAGSMPLGGAAEAVASTDDGTAAAMIAQDDERQQDAEGAGHGIAHATRSPGPLREPLAP